MTIDGGLKPEGAGALPHSGAGAPSMQSMRSAIRSNARWRWWRVCCGWANRWMSWPGKQNVSVAKRTEWKERALAGAASA